MRKTHSPKRDLMREQLAHHAARLMAEDGITNYAFAKQKAAKQLKATDTQHLPSNEEIEAALLSYRSLYQHDKHPAVIKQLREEAKQAMLLLAPFQPYLAGSVLRGTAGAYSDINLQLFSDDTKAVLLYLLDQKVEFESGEWEVRLNGRKEIVPSYTLFSDSGTAIHVLVLPENAQFSGGRHTNTHADLATVNALLDQS